MATERVVRLEVLPGGAEGGDGPIRLRPPERGRHYCGHNRTELDQDARRVFCQECGAEVDSFDALLTFAREWERWRSRIGELKRYAASEADRLEAVKRDLRNAKSRLKTARRRLGAEER